METWTISPTTVNRELITNNNNGEFIFPANTGAAITFTIIYSIDGVEKGRTQYVLGNGEECSPCNFSIAPRDKLGCGGGETKFEKVTNQ